jgi:DNA-binding SARP family transcriptional activator/tetratricopeptide (TPR) repeat protein
LYNGETSQAAQSARLRDLITYLLLQPGVPHPRGTLAALFWPESPDSQARTNLRKLVMDLRRALPQPERFVDITDRDLSWRADAPCAVDVLDFERLSADGAGTAELEQAAQLYRGDLVPQCYDDWVTPRREALRDRFASVLERLVASCERRRDHATAIRYAQRLLDHDPLLEATYRLLMRLHALTGDRTGAVRIYHACATTLQRELSVAPSAETREAYERIVAGARPALQPMALPPMLGRGAEWERLQDAWRAATAGRTQIVVVRGEPGIGKSRLVEELLDWVGHQGIPSAFARCYAAETDLAYAPVTALLRARPLPPLTPALRREVARLVPSLLHDDPAAAPPAMRESWQQQHLYDALARVVLSDQPIVLVIDDLHWCDEESLGFLHYLTRYDPAARLLIVVTLRPDEVGPDHPVQRCVASWRHAGALTEIELQPLGLESTVAVASAITGTALDDRVATRFFQDTEGHPLLIVEMARAGRVVADHDQSPIPSRVRDIVRARLAGLSPASRALAGVAATVGRSFTFGLLAEVSGEDDDALIRCLDELWQRRIIREHGAMAYDFGHDVLREVASSELSPTKRRWLHRQVAQALEAMHAGALDEVSGQIAGHYEQAGMLERAVPFYLRAAEAAERVYASDVAINCFHRLLAIEQGVDRIPVMRRLGDVWQRLGRWNDAEQIYRQALSAAENSNDSQACAECLIGVGAILRLTGRYAEAIAAFERAREEYERLEIARGVSRTIGHLGIVHFERGDMLRALDCFKQQQQIAERLSDNGELSNALRDMGLVYWLQGEYEQAIACHERCLALAAERGERSGIEGMNALNNLGLVYRAQGDFARAVDCHQQSLQIASQIANRRGEGVALGNLGIDHEQNGDYLVARDYLVRQLAIATELGDRRSVSLAIGHLGNVYEALGGRTLASECFARQLHAAAEIGDRRVIGIALGNVARLWVAEGRFDEAEVVCRRSLTIFKELRLPFYLCEAQYRLADLYFQRREYARARAVASDAALTASGIRRAPIEFAARLISIRASHADHTLTTEAAAGACQALLERFGGDRQQAAAHFAMWQITGSAESRAAATVAYRRLVETYGRIEHFERLQALTGERQGAPVDLGPLPGLLSDPGPDLDGLVGRLEVAAAAT